MSTPSSSSTQPQTTASSLPPSTSPTTAPMQVITPVVISHTISAPPLSSNPPLRTSVPLIQPVTIAPVASTPQVPTTTPVQVRTVNTPAIVVPIAKPLNQATSAMPTSIAQGVRATPSISTVPVNALVPNAMRTPQTTASSISTATAQPTAAKAQMVILGTLPHLAPSGQKIVVLKNTVTGATQTALLSTNLPSTSSSSSTATVSLIPYNAAKVSMPIPQARVNAPVPGSQTTLAPASTSTTSSLSSPTVVPVSIFQKSPQVPVTITLPSGTNSLTSSASSPTSLSTPPVNLPAPINLNNPLASPLSLSSSINLSASNSSISTSAPSTQSGQSSTSADVTWTIVEQAKLQRALIKYGTSFGQLSSAIASKSSGQVKKYYHATGGAKGSFRHYLAEHHKLKKQDGVLDNFPLELQPDEEESIKAGKLPNMFPDAEMTDPHPDTPPTEIEKDPCEGMDEAQRLQYKRKRAEMIFTANDRGIFLACDDLNAEPLTSPKVKMPKRSSKQLKSSQSLSSSGFTTTTTTTTTTSTPQPTTPPTTSPVLSNIRTAPKPPNNNHHHDNNINNSKIKE